MTDSATQNEDWIGAWIARQRELLEQQAAALGKTGADAGAEETSQQWATLGQLFTNSWAQALGGMQMPGPRDPFNVGEALLSAWNTASTLQSNFAQQTAETLRRLPPIGLAREQTEAWREWAEAHAEARRLERELQAVLIQVQLDALALLQKQVDDRAADRPIENFRALYDMWVDCGEQVYGKLAHSEAYAKLQAQLGNASMRVRARQQTVLEHGLKQFDLPTRSEINSLHRQVRDLKLQLEALQSRAKPRTQRRPKRKAAKK